MKTNRVLCILSVLMVWASSTLAQIHLFRPQAKEPERVFVYDFLERYLGEITSMKNLTEVNQKLASDKVFFVKGTIADIKQLTDSTSFSLICFEEKVYHAAWTFPDKSELVIAFPVSFELMLGLPKFEIEKKMQTEFQQLDTSSHPCLPDIDQLVLLDNGLYQIASSTCYYIKELSDNCFFTKDSNGFRPVFDSLYVAESLANMFHYYTGRDYIISIQQNIYGFKNLRYRINLSQWLAYQQKYEMHTYIAIEDVFENDIKLLVLAECRMLGFNHLLSVLVPKNIFKNRDTELNAQLNAFIPTHNVKNLYQPLEAKDSLHRKIQIQ